MLWQQSLVMMDLQTGSLWSHLLGRAMRGPLGGQELDMLPSAMTDWKTWRSEHPDTTVLALSRTSREYQRDFYRDPSQFVFGMAEGDLSRAGLSTTWPKSPSSMINSTQPRSWSFSCGTTPPSPLTIDALMARRSRSRTSPVSCWTRRPGPNGIRPVARPSRVRCKAPNSGNRSAESASDRRSAHPTVARS